MEEILRSVLVVVVVAVTVTTTVKVKVEVYKVTVDGGPYEAGSQYPPSCRLSRSSSAYRIR